MLGRSAHLPLNADPANRYLPWIVALMVYLAALALAGAVVLGGVAARWSAGQSDRVTVQLPPSDQAEIQLEAAVTLMRDTPGIASAEPVARAELVRLLEPWLGKGNVSSDLPLPRLIDVTLAPGAPPDLRALELRLQAVVPGAQVDDHGYWLGRLAAVARSMQWIALAVVLAIGSAAAATVVFSTRTSLAVHQETLDVLHIIGANDRFVARAFERQALVLGLRGGLIGVALAALTLGLIHNLVSGLDAPLLPRIDVTPLALGALAAVPVASALIAMVTARITVMRALARLP